MLLLRVLLPLLVPTAALAQSQAAPAPPCQSAQLHAELDGRPDWASRVEALRAKLHGARIDPCARVDVRSEGERVVVTVTSRERSAARTLTRPGELERTVEALVVLPPLIESSAELPPEEVVTKPVPRPEPTHVELAAGAAVRIGGNVYAGGGPSFMADVVVDHYLLGISGRWEVADDYVSEPTASGFSMESGAIGVVVGRRVELGWGSVEGMLEANVVVESEEGSGTPNEIGGETADVRGGLATRLAVGRRFSICPYVLFDVEGSPARLRKPRQLDLGLPTLPAWSAGLAIGVMWRLR